MILTFTGRLIDPFKLEPKDISIRDIAHALSMTCRWGGHTSRFYSVAEHCVRLVEFADTSNEASPFLGSLDLKKLLLLHDASEAYLTDVPSPYKARPEFAAFVAFEHEVQRVIDAHFDLERLKRYSPLNAAVKRLDVAILGNEAAELLPLERLNISLPAPLREAPNVLWREHRHGPAKWKFDGPSGSDMMATPTRVVTDNSPWGWTPEQAEAIFLDQYTRLFGDTE